MKRSYLLIGKIFLAVLFVMGLNQSCTNLDEELYSEVTPDEFLQGDEQYVSALGAAYSSLSGYAAGGDHSIQEVCTDEMVVPTRGGDWDDGGHWRRLHLHSWNYEDPEPNGAWGFYFSGVNNCNRNIALFQSLAENGDIEQSVADEFVPELIVLRSFFYWLLIDTFGNVPFVDSFFDADPQPPTVERATVFAAVMDDLVENVPKLSKAKDGTTYGRMNYWAGLTLMAKMYLNAEVYTGTEMYDEVITACDEIINDGGFALESNYFANFTASNTGTNEMIFAIPYDQVFLTGFNLVMRTLHYGSQDTYNATSQPWNGFCSLGEFYNSYEDTDLRKGTPGTLDGPSTTPGNFIAGYQYKSNGDLVTDSGFESPNPDREPEPLLGDPDGEPLNFGNLFSDPPRPIIHELGPQALRQDGVRIGKWEFEQGLTSEMSNDYAVFRYADVLLMKAEALWRTTGSATNAEALALVNEIRDRAGVDPISTLDGELSYEQERGVVAGGELLNEMGRELFGEHHRRRQLIRWGEFTNVEAWGLPIYNPGDFFETGSFTTLFAIPRDRLDANPNLVQNPGY